MIDTCWLWTGAKSNGYGHVSVAGHSQLVHRAVYEAMVGTIPDGHEIDHRCYERACYNPAHLEAISHRENVRRSSGERHGRAKLTVENVRLIRTECDGSRGAVSRFARELGVTPQAIWGVVHGKTWRHVS